MKRRNFIKGIVAATAGLALAPVIMSQEKEPKAIFDWKGFELMPYTIYTDGKNQFLALSKSELVNIQENGQAYTNGPILIRIGSCLSEF